MNEPRGSLWRAWDLHFHTPSSFDYQNKSVSNEQIINTLLNNDVEVIAITDHHVIDIERLKDLKSLAQEKICVLPGIEFRTELGGKESMHFCAIFDENANIDLIWKKLSAQLNLSVSEIASMGGNEGVYVKFVEAAVLVKSLGGIITVHAGNKTNSIENISNSEYFKRILKKDLVTKYIDIFEISNPRDIEGYQTIVFPSINKSLPIIVCSDNHNINNYSRTSLCWVKGNPCFNTLKVALIEPTQRVFIGDFPEKLAVVSKNPAQYIKSIRYSKIIDSPLKEDWFDKQEIPLNIGLVSIIGNQGSGKSALVETLGLLGNSRNLEYYSFLHKDRFKLASDNKASQFESEIVWEDGKKKLMNLNESTDLNSVELVRFIPQGLFEKICNEIGVLNSNFERELKKVIFSHVEGSKRLGLDSLDELVNYQIKEINSNIFSAKNKLDAINKEIVDIETKSSPEYLNGLKSILEEKNRELKNLLKTKPKSILEPAGEKGQSALFAQLEINKNKISTLTKKIKDKGAVLSKIEKEKSRINLFIESVNNLNAKYLDLIETYSKDLSSLGFDINKIIKLEVTKNHIDKRIEQNTKQINSITALLDPTQKLSLPAQKEDLTQKNNKILEKLDKPNKEYENYKQKLIEFESNKKNIIGSKNNVGSITYLNERIDETKTFPEILRTLQLKRIKKVSEIYQSKEKIAGIYRDLFEPVQKFVANHHIAHGKYNLQFAVSTIIDGFEEKFFIYIIQNVSGSFHGVTDGEKKLRSIIEKYNFNTEDSILSFIDEILVSLTSINKKGTSEKMTISSQLSKSVDLVDFYNFLFSLDYLFPTYVLRYDNKDLKVLSPGERGALLLIFYLLIDKERNPLIIDQPEGNLDNQIVFELLVECIKEAKQLRQIIIVTHNPNLAIVTDAEQLIYCEKNHENKVTFTSGAIEEFYINKKAVDVLEGTKPAFENRSSKYD